MSCGPGVGFTALGNRSPFTGWVRYGCPVKKTFLLDTNLKLNETFPVLQLLHCCNYLNNAHITTNITMATNQVDATLNPVNRAGNFIHHDERSNIDGGSLLGRLSLKNKTAIISGAGGGIGYSVATGYAEMGCNIAIWYSSNKKAIEKAEALAQKYNIKCGLTTSTRP